MSTVILVEVILANKLSEVGLRDCLISRLYGNRCLDYESAPLKSVDFSSRVYLFDVGSRKLPGV